MQEELNAAHRSSRLELLLVELPDMATPHQVLTAVDRIGNAAKEAGEAAQKLRYLLGKAMLFVQAHECYKPEHETFEAWQVALADRLRLSRATVAKCAMMARNLPNVDPSRLAHIPITNLELTARVASQLGPQQIAGLLRRAENAEVIEFKRVVESRGLLGRAAKAGYVTLTVRVRPGVAKAWKRYVGDGDASAAFAGVVQSLDKKRAAA